VISKLDNFSRLCVFALLIIPSWTPFSYQSRWVKSGNHIPDLRIPRWDAEATPKAIPNQRVRDKQNTKNPLLDKLFWWKGEEGWTNKKEGLLGLWGILRKKRRKRAFKRERREPSCASANDVRLVLFYFSSSSCLFFCDCCFFFFAVSLTFSSSRVSPKDRKRNPTSAKGEEVRNHVWSPDSLGEKERERERAAKSWRKNCEKRSDAPSCKTKRLINAIFLSNFSLNQK